MSSITNIYPLDFTCYYDETSDEYNIPKDELIELLEVVEVLGNQNKKLKEENKKLTKERDDFEVQWHKSLEGQVELEDEIQELKEEIVKGNEAHKCNTKTIWSGIEKINKLEDENKKLKEQLNTVIN